MPFEPINVEGNPALVEDLKRLGAMGIPALVGADRVFYGWNPKELAAFVGVKHVDPERLPPADLMERLDRVLEASQRAIRQVPEKCLDSVSPGRNRSVRNLAYHIFRLSLAFCEAIDQKEPAKKGWADEAPPEIEGGEGIALYGEKVRKHLKKYERVNAWDTPVLTDSGPQTAHAYLERTVWHAAQHLRQLYSLLEQMGERPNHPLDDREFKDLPLPAEVW